MFGQIVKCSAYFCKVRQDENTTNKDDHNNDDDVNTDDTNDLEEPVNQPPRGR